MAYSFAETAKKYAALGWKVFPCGAKTKEPLVKWRKECTDDPSKIDMWAQVYSDACNVGIACGESNLVVLDADPKNGGLESLPKLADKIPELRQSWVAKTGSGGYHVYFRARSEMPIGNSAGKLASGIDMRGDGGYVVAPGSTHPNGTPYSWVTKTKEFPKSPLLDIPLELIELCLVAKTKPGTTSGADGDGMIPPGERHSYFLSMAGALRARGVGENGILSALRAANEQQCDPLHDDDDLVRIAGDYSTKSVGEMRYGAKTWSMKQKERLALSEGKATTGRKWGLRAYKDIQKREVEWLWQDRIEYGSMNLLVGMPGKGKSYATCYIAAALSNGVPLPGSSMMMQTEPQEVLLLTYEDGQDSVIKPRLERCGADMSKVYTIYQDDGAFTLEDIPTLIDNLEEHPGIRSVFIDPIQSAMGDINDNVDTELRNGLQPLLLYCAQKKIALVGLKHLNKSESQNILNRIGGSIGYVGLSRSILLAGHDNEKPHLTAADPGGPQTYGGLMSLKGNHSGYVQPLSYVISNSGFEIFGTDDTLTSDRLLPKPKEKKSGG